METKGSMFPYLKTNQEFHYIMFHFEHFPTSTLNQGARSNFSHFELNICHIVWICMLLESLGIKIRATWFGQ